MESSQEGAQAKLKSQTEKFDLRRNAFIREHLLEVAELQWTETKNELESVLTEGKLKGDEKSLEYLAWKKELIRDKAKVECLLKQSVKDKGNLESQRWEKRLSDNMEEAGFMLQEMKSMLKEGLGARGLEVQLKEQIAKSELLLEEMKLAGVVEEVGFEKRFTDVVVKSPVLKMQLKKHIVKVESLLENMKFFHEESKEDAIELNFLLRKMKLAQESGKVKSSLSRSMLEAYVAKLKLLLDETELEKEKEEIGSQMLKIELLEELRREGSLLMTSSWVLYSEIRNLEKILSILQEMKSEHKGEGLKPQVLEQKEKEEHATTSKSPQEKMELVQEESNIKSPALGMLLKECIVELDGELKKGKLEFLKEKLKFRKLTIQLHRHIVEPEPLLEKMKLEQEKERVRSQELKMELNEDIAKLELLLEETELEERHVAELKRFIAKAKKINLIREESTMKSATLEMQFEKRRDELESLFHEMKLVSWPEERWQIKFRRQHEAELEFLLEGIKLKQEEKRLQSRELEMELEELESLLKEIESERHVEVPESLALKMRLEGHLRKVKSLLETLKRQKQKPESSTMARELRPGEQEVLYKPIGVQHIIVIGGRDQHGQSLSSVEGYIFLEGRWIELPAMNTQRSFMSSVVVGNEIVVSGGHTDLAITDTIEVLNLAETPLRWRMSPARLPVPLCAHQTVVYEGKLVVIGGHDGNEGRNSDKIYEVLLTPPYSNRILRNLFTPVAWHGAELVGDEIFIFGGGRTIVVPTCAVFVYNLVRNTLHEKHSLPRPIQGMATVTKAMRVAVIGGYDDNAQELNEVFIYDLWSGECHNLPQMNEIRGPCSAVISLTLDTSRSCSSDASCETLVVLGSPSSPNVVEGCNFDTRLWKAMPPTREAREFCSVVATPIEFEFEKHL